MGRLVRPEGRSGGSTVCVRGEVSFRTRMFTERDQRKLGDESEGKQCLRRVLKVISFHRGRTYVFTPQFRVTSFKQEVPVCSRSPSVLTVDLESRRRSQENDDQRDWSSRILGKNYVPKQVKGGSCPTH